ncbi:SOS response-associated peptidase family protein [Formosa sp. 3Alg 14/1]|uniref:SOS response-associated peptidase family protein n=1 Tax=Formosa sp. 3Alg 14/1 TaxID=3382190 RepID=UPI0039BDF899
MFYQISNIANRVSVEDTLSAKFKFPHLYKPKKRIDGTAESVLPILTAKDNKHLQYAIWGMLPESFRGDWKPYQNNQNTLNIKTGTLKKHLEFYRDSEVKRCLVPMTGYMDFSMSEGEVTPFFVNHTKNTPFCVAGIYNQLEDGFFTFSIIIQDHLDEHSNSISKFQPAILKRELHDRWLNPKIDTLHALELLEESHDYILNRFPTSTHLLLNCSSEGQEDEEELGLEDAV